MKFAKAWLAAGVVLAASQFGALHAQDGNPEWRALRQELVQRINANCYDVGTLELAQQVLQAAQRTGGVESADTALSLVLLAHVHQRQGQLTRAAQSYTAALAIQEKTAGPDSPMVAFTLSALAGLHYRREAFDQAIALYERALAIHEKQQRPDAHAVLYSRQNLAAAHRAQGAYAKAAPLYERELDARAQPLLTVALMH